MLVKYTVSELLSAKGSFSSIDICVDSQAVNIKYDLNLPLVRPISDYPFHPIRNQMWTNERLPFVSNQQTGELIISQSDICLME